MRTSTSIGSLVYGLFGRILRSSRTPSREKLCKPLGYGLWDELIHASPERGDLLHAARRDEADGRARHHVDRPSASSRDRKSTRLNSSHVRISYAVFCLKKKKSTHVIR